MILYYKYIYIYIYTYRYDICICVYMYIHIYDHLYECGAPCFCVRNSLRECFASCQFWRTLARHLCSSFAMRSMPWPDRVWRRSWICCRLCCRRTGFVAYDSMTCFTGYDLLGWCEIPALRKDHPQWSAMYMIAKWLLMQNASLFCSLKDLVSRDEEFLQVGAEIRMVSQ